LTLFLALLTGLITGPVQARELVDRVAAVVEGEVITLTEVYDLGADYIEGRAAALESERRVAELEVLDELVERALVDQEVERLGLGVTQEELDRAIDDVARQNGIDRKRLQGEVERSGMDWAIYRDELEQQLKFMKFHQTVILPRINVRDDELKAIYKRRFVDGASDGQRQLQAIFLRWEADAPPEVRIAAVQKAADLKGRLDAGEDWLTVAADAPESPYAALDTEFGNFLEGELLPELDAAAFSIEVGQVTDPVAASGGVFLIRVAAVLPPEIPPFEEVKDQLAFEIQEVKGEEELAMWATMARRRSSVEIRLASPRE
jgi:peptidyl-prolyl cis-trans isomerase SurA